MAVMKLTEDTPLTSLFEFLPESKDLLRKYGLDRIEKDGVDGIILKRLTIKGFMNLLNMPEDVRADMWNKLQELYNNKLMEAK
ncbi:MAG: hypothetical protein GXN96_02335 [Aquificae bacterium]|nr:hypothetical protein [Aquificota bacterium]